jgi:hypothetical protein
MMVELAAPEPDDTLHASPCSCDACIYAALSTSDSSGADNSRQEQR